MAHERLLISPSPTSSYAPSGRIDDHTFDATSSQSDVQSNSDSDGSSHNSEENDHSSYPSIAVQFSRVNGNYGDSKEDDYQLDLEDARPNRWTGPTSTWLKLTAHDRGIVDGLEKTRNADLALHLYNAFVLRKRMVDIQVNRCTFSVIRQLT